MNNLLICDYCGQPFDMDERLPLILHQCGCTFCQSCIQDMLETQRIEACPNDNEEILEKSIEECRRNTKILNFMNSE